MLDQPQQPTTTNPPAGQHTPILPADPAQYQQWRATRRQALLAELYEIERQMLADGQIKALTIERRRR